LRGGHEPSKMPSATRGTRCGCCAAIRRSRGLVSARPLGGIGPATSISDPASPLPPDTSPLVADVRFADDGYFEAAGVELKSGGVPLRADAAGPPRVVVNEALARSIWNGNRAVGERLSLGIFDGIEADVIGVVGDVHLADVRTPPRATAYLSASRYTDASRDLVARTAGEPDDIVPALRRTLAELDPVVPLAQVTTLEALVDGALASDAFITVLLGGFAVVALLLAAAGIFGVASNEMAGRRREIGIRLALGARPHGLVTQVVAQAVSRALAGVALGSLLGYAVARSIASLLFGVSPFDAPSFAGSAAVLLVTSCFPRRFPRSAL